MIGGARGASAIETGGGLGGEGGGGGPSCGAAVGTTAAGSPTAGSCTTSTSNLSLWPTFCETCLDTCGVSAEFLRMIENT